MKTRRQDKKRGHRIRQGRDQKGHKRRQGESRGTKKDTKYALNTREEMRRPQKTKEAKI